MTNLAVPRSFDEVTTSWFAAALHEGGMLDASIDSITVEPMAASKGLIGDLATVHVSHRQGSGPTSFVIKLPAANPDSRRIGEMLQAYSREVAFYRHVAPRSPGTRLPRCYYTGEDVDAGRWAIVLESIVADEFDFLAGATAAQANAAVDALADFHATWWESSTIFDWMPGFDKGGVSALQPMWLSNLPAFIERYRDVLPDPTPEWVLAFAPMLSTWCQTAATEPLTMVHADYRIDNLLFQRDHGDQRAGTAPPKLQVTMIDWQTTMRGPAAMDLSSFIATSLAIDARREREHELIERYLDRLLSRGTKVDRDWFLRSYDENLLWWMGQFGNNLAHLDPGDDQTQAALTAMVSRVYTNAVDRDVGRLLS